MGVRFVYFIISARAHPRIVPLACRAALATTTRARLDAKRPDEPAWPADGTRRNMPSLTSMGTDSANIRCEGLLVVIASSWTKHRRRWFVLDGYHVAFYKTRELTVRRGRFDLRHVLRIEPSRLAGRDVASASRVVPAWRHSCSPPCRTLGWHWPAARCAFRAGGAAGTQTPNERPRLGCQAGPKPLAVHALSTPPLHAASPRRLSTPQDLGEGIPPGVELLLDELGTRVAVAFADAADARQWLGLWCSACAVAVVTLLVGSRLFGSATPRQRYSWWLVITPLGSATAWQSGLFGRIRWGWAALCTS